MDERLNMIAGALPSLFALALSAFALTVSAERTLDVTIFPDRSEVEPKELSPDQDTQATPPLSPAPNWDDRLPLEYVSQGFGLDDPALTTKLAGIGPTFWKGAGQGTGALIAPDVVLTTGHLFAKNGRWHGGSPLGRSAPDAKNGSIYLAACGQSYTFASVELGSLAPRRDLGLDYAIARLTTPACPEALVLPIGTVTADYALQHDSHRDVLLNMGAYRFIDLPRFAAHPFFKQTPGRDPYHVFGVRCRMTKTRRTSSEAGLIVTDGCDGVPGGSGGPLLLSRDGGASYQIVGVANSFSRRDAEFNNYTLITGVFARHLKRVLPALTLAKE